ncbi:Vesicular glutamate transporter 2.2, partial [Pseudolycoriella hygida]
TFQFTACVGFGFFLLLASYAGLEHAIAISFVLLAHTLMGAFFPSLRVNAIDLTPNYAGTLISITNGFGSLSGFAGAYSAGMLTPNATLEEWRMVFWISFIIFTVTSAIYCIWASAEQQEWNDLGKTKTETNVKVADEKMSVD